MVRRPVKWTLMLAMSLMLAVGCSDEVEPNPRLRVSIFGWGPTDVGAANEFVQGMPVYEGASVVRVSVTDPARDRIVGQKAAALQGGKVALPDTGFGEGLRLELEVLDDNEQVLASGSTPKFTVESGSNSRAMRMLVTPTNAFAPVGSLVITSGGVREFQASRLDYRAECARAGGCQGVWLGRVGHAVAPTSDGKVLIVGGAEEIPGSVLGAIPNIKRLHADVQIFDPETGYFSDLSFDEATQAPREDGLDQLQEPRAWSTLTPLGGDRFLVVGGYTKAGEESFALNNIELIDLKAAPGDRVKLLQNVDGTSLKLNTARGFHTAVYRPESNQVVIAGGVGASATQILDSIEVINLDNNTVTARPEIKLASARTGHAALKLDNGSIWVIGGRSADAVLASTEIISFSETAISSAAGPTMKEGRFDFGATQVGASDRVIVVGGYTSIAGAVTGSYELGITGRPEFVSFVVDAAKLGTPRGGLNLVRLPQSGDVVVFGGRDAQGLTVGNAERLQFLGLDGSLPYEVLSEGLGIMHVKRYGAQAALMTNGRILIVGGLGVDTTQQATVSLDNAELYNARDPVAGGLFIP